MGGRVAFQVTCPSFSQGEDITLFSGFHSCTVCRCSQKRSRRALSVGNTLATPHYTGFLIAGLIRAFSVLMSLGSSKEMWNTALPEFYELRMPDCVSGQALREAF